MEAAGLTSGDRDQEHKGSLYHDDNSPDVPWEPSLVFTVVVLIFLNCLSPSLIAITLGVGWLQILLLISGGLVLHIGILLMSKRLFHIARHPPAQTVEESNVA